jgi:mannose/cellobiose epimerase-like protein (N-acyl-D-glucosamine 2-epimerase family)
MMLFWAAFLSVQLGRVGVLTAVVNQHRPQFQHVFGCTQMHADDELIGNLVWDRYHADWSVDWDYNRNDKTNKFRLWGYQTGHLTEWAKLLLQLERQAPAAWLIPQAEHFFNTAIERGWDPQHGTWHNLLSNDNRLRGDQKSSSGKTDYHIMGACCDMLRAMNVSHVGP